MDELGYKAKIQTLRKKIMEMNIERKNLIKKYDELVKRYRKQNDELTILKEFLSKEGYYDNTRGK